MTNNNNNSLVKAENRSRTLGRIGKVFVYITDTV